MDKFWANIDKFLLSFLLLVLVVIIAYCDATGRITTSLSWYQGIAGQLLAALLTLMVGRALNRNTDPAGTNSSPAVSGPVLKNGTTTLSVTHKDDNG